jgi:phage protein U
MANWVLFQWGPIQFQVFPMNVGEMSHHTAADWARKEIAGAAMYREWVGENDEQIQLKGKVFPHYFARQTRNWRSKWDATSANARKRTGLLEEKESSGLPSSGGLGHLDVLDNMRRTGQAHALLRGDGWHFGWFIIDQLQRGHSLLAHDGIGQQIEFEASFQRVPIPNDPAAHFGYLWGSTQGA